VRRLLSLLLAIGGLLTLITCADAQEIPLVYHLPPLSPPSPDYKAESVTIPPDIFPIGGFNFAVGHEVLPADQDHPERASDDYKYRVNLLKAMHLNCVYDALVFGTRSSAPYMTGGFKGYDQLEPIGDYVGNAFGGKASEYRFFLASNEAWYDGPLGNKQPNQFGIYNTHEYDLDTRQSWVYRPNNVSANNGEYGIQLNAQDGHTSDYVLEGLQYFDPRTSAEEMAKHWHLSGIAGPNFPNDVIQSPTIVCDFIYRIDPSLLPSGTGSSDVLYDVEYYYIKVTYDGTAYASSTESAHTDHITLNAWNNPALKNRESYNILHFPKADPTIAALSAANFTPQHYATIGYAIPMPASEASTNWNTSVPVAGMWKYVGIDCKLHRYVATPIWVRGLRVRSDLADRILTEEPTTKAAIQQIFLDRRTLLQSTVVNGVSAWDNVLGFATGQELHDYSQRILSYLDDLCFKTIGKHLHAYPLENNDTRMPSYRQTYEDQNLDSRHIGKIPAPFQSEQAWLGITTYPGADGELSDGWKVRKAGGNLPIPRDALAHELRHITDDNNNEVFERFVMPITGEINAKGTALEDIDPTVPINYLDYRDRFQERLGLMPGLEAALTAYPPYTTAKHWGVWYAQAPVAMIINGAYLSPGEPLDFVLLNTMTPTRRAEMLQWSADNCRTLDAYPFRDYELTKPRSVQYQANRTTGTKFSMLPELLERPQLATEMRASVWTQICAGAKGVFFNSIGNDGNGQSGIPFDETERQMNYDLTKTHGVYYGPVASCSDPLISNINAGSWNAPEGKMTLRHVTKRVVGPGGPFYDVRPIPIMDPRSGGTAELQNDQINSYLTWEFSRDPSKTDPNGYAKYYDTWLTPTGWAPSVSLECSDLQGANHGLDAVSSDGSDQISSATMNFTPLVGQTVLINIGAKPLFKIGSVDPTNTHVAHLVTFDGNPAALLASAGAEFWIGGTFANVTQTRGLWEANCGGSWTVASSPQTPWASRIWAPMWYGWKERWDGCLRIADDLAPIGTRLSQLQWRFTMNLANANGSTLGDNSSRWSTDPNFSFKPANQKFLVDSLAIGNFISHFVRTLDPTQLETVAANNPQPTVNGTPVDPPTDMFYQFGAF
jgi:hypothetical protein